MASKFGNMAWEPPAECPDLLILGCPDFPGFLDEAERIHALVGCDTQLTHLDTHSLIKKQAMEIQQPDASTWEAVTTEFG